MTHLSFVTKFLVLMQIFIHLTKQKILFMRFILMETMMWARHQPTMFSICLSHQDSMMALHQEKWKLKQFQTSLSLMQMAQLMKLRQMLFLPTIVVNQSIQGLFHTTHINTVFQPTLTTALKQTMVN